MMIDQKRLVNLDYQTLERSIRCTWALEQLGVSPRMEASSFRESSPSVGNLLRDGITMHDNLKAFSPDKKTMHDDKSTAKIQRL